MKVVPVGDGFREMPPQDFRPGLADLARASNTFRYLYYQTGLVHRVKGLVDRYFWGGNENFGSGDLVSSAVDIRSITDIAKMRDVSRYILRNMRELATHHEFELIFAMDGVREAVYSGRAPESYEVGLLNQMMAALAKEEKLTFIDLQEEFTSTYVKEQTRFEFSWDWHWNVRGHRLVGEVLARHIEVLAKMQKLKPAVLSQTQSALSGGRLTAAGH